MQVAVRIRPLAPKELIKENIQVTARGVDDGTVLITEPTPDQYDDVLRKDRPKERLYTFDQVFGEYATQAEVFEKTVKYLINWVVKGYNATVFAYGATGAGKTYTMLGTEAHPGIMALTLVDLFASINERNTNTPFPSSRATTPSPQTFTVSLSYLEIYNENIRDLLSGKADYLDLREDSQKGVVVSGITSVSARSPEEVLAFLRKGNKHRTQEATGANEVSSRSHAVLQVVVCNHSMNEKGKRTERYGKLSMIDLAGSERAAETKNRGMRMVEGANINRSLLALGNCITALADTSKRGKYVNYRDSKLTRLLKDSLGGNCRTVMIANISPASTNFDETLNTLKYASRARAIKTKVTQQVSHKYDPYTATIQQLNSEIGLLKNRLIRAESTSTLTGRRSSTLNPPLLSTTREAATSTIVLPRIRLVPEETGRPGTKDSAATTLKQSIASTPPEHSMFTELQTMLEEKFEEYREVRSRALEVEEEIAECVDFEKEGESSAEDVVHAKRKAMMEKAELGKKMAAIDQEIRNIQQSIPRSLDRRSRQYLDLLIKAHFTEIENLDLLLSHTLHTAALSHTTTSLNAAHQHIDILDRISTMQREVITARSIDIPSRLLELYEDLNNVIVEKEGRDAKVEVRLMGVRERLERGQQQRREGVDETSDEGGDDERQERGGKEKDGKLPMLIPPKQMPYPIHSNPLAQAGKSRSRLLLVDPEGMASMRSSSTIRPPPPTIPLPPTPTSKSPNPPRRKSNVKTTNTKQNTNNPLARLRRVYGTEADNGKKTRR